MYQVNLSFPTVQDFSLIFYFFYFHPFLFTFKHRIETGICMGAYTHIHHNTYTHWGATSTVGPSHSPSCSLNVLCVITINKLGFCISYLKTLRVSLCTVCSPIKGAFSQCSMVLYDIDKLHNPSLLILYECGWQQCVSTPVHCGTEDPSGQHC